MVKGIDVLIEIITDVVLKITSNDEHVLIQGVLFS
jgi:hypothetical protein